MFIRDKHKDALEIASSTEGKHTSGLSKMKGVSERKPIFILDSKNLTEFDGRIQSGHTSARP